MCCVGKEGQYKAKRSPTQGERCLWCRCDHFCAQEAEAVMCWAEGVANMMEPQLNERSEHLGNSGQEQCDCEQFRSCLCQSLAGKHTFLLSASRGPMQCSGQGHPQNPMSISALQVQHVQRLCSWLWPTCAPKCKPPGVRRLQG